MKSKSTDKEVMRVTNPLARYDPEQPAYIPKTFSKAYKRSVYFPKEKASLLYQVDQIAKEAARAGSKMTFNDVVIEAIELWYQQNLRSYLRRLLHRLSGRRFALTRRLHLLTNKSKRASSDATELSAQHATIRGAIRQIEKYLYEQRSIISTGDYDQLITEIISSLKTHSSTEMNNALSKVLARSDIHELAAKVRHKPKIKKKENIFGIDRDEEPEWYD